MASMGGLRHPHRQDPDGRPLGAMLAFIEEDFAMAENMVRRHTQYMIDYCQGLIRAYQETGDAAWLEKHRSTVQQHINRFDAFGVHQAQCRDALQATLEPLQVHSANDVLSAAGNREAVLNPTTPVASPQNAILIPQYYTPHQVKEESVSPLPISLEKRISMSMLRHKEWKLRFTLLYAGNPIYSAPEWYFARKVDGEWVVDGWKASVKVVQAKTYLVLGTRRNANIAHQAHIYLKNYKDILIHELAKSKDLSLEHHRPDI
ncbi:hypothetical protein F5Y00DRAFT_267400 [Daldinia vernicosa]|uniref:uncharacterized protein n=1 Tax=Daldinia vernicosa TaxID=114800 RepID=UPI002007448C|nr:uncharacterized protein F5Y00DRAFT_267400 [Daldinia vernicosa]KAI0854133.1 hypothetical protein F5Y00DRAFT_267400 [Daldinia vernicosa]